VSPRGQKNAHLMTHSLQQFSSQPARAALLGLLLAAPVAAQTTQRVSVDSAGTQSNELSYGAMISANGRYVTFHSNASNLVPNDTNASYDIFVRDLQSGTTERVSVDQAGVQGNWNSFRPSISADGRYVAFESQATNLDPMDTNGTADIFVHDRLLGTNERISVDSSGAQADSNSYGASISADGRYVAFLSAATNLVPGDTNGILDAFVRDRQTGTTTRVSVDSAGAQCDGECQDVSISANGRFVAFQSAATNLVPGDTNGQLDDFVHDLTTGTTERVSVGSGGVEGLGAVYGLASLSADGRFVAFCSDAGNLVPGDTNACRDAFVHDRQSGATQRVSITSAGAQADGDSIASDISSDGRYVSFYSLATNLVPGDTNGVYDAFIHDRSSGTTARVSLDSSGAQGNGNSGLGRLSSDSRLVAFVSDATNLVSGDTNGFRDIFVRDLGATSFTSLCEPGFGGVSACPCSNPPAGSGRGCDNSAASGGAALSATGSALLSGDTLVFTTSGEMPIATSIVLQGDAGIPAGVAFGQGVRCAGGTLKRLFVKTATGGSMTAPDFGAGDPTLSARSAALGDTILSGQCRWYLVYYRDPVVLGSCPATSTFNATQTGVVGWQP